MVVKDEKVEVKGEPKKAEEGEGEKVELVKKEAPVDKIDDDDPLAGLDLDGLFD